MARMKKEESYYSKLARHGAQKALVDGPQSQETSAASTPVENVTVKLGYGDQNETEEKWLCVLFSWPILELYCRAK